MIERLRKSEAFIPELSLIAKQDGKIIGHIMFTKIKIGNTTQIALAPVCVDSKFQRQGIGGKLIKEGHRIAKELDYEFSIVLGHPSYYPRFGYTKAKDFAIKAPFEIEDQYFMAYNFLGKNTQLNGTVEYAKEFFEKT